MKIKKLGIDAMSLIKGGPNTENAKKFYAWSLTKEGQLTSLKADMMHTPANPAAKSSPAHALMDGMKLINYNYKAYGNSVRRSQLINRWEKEVNSLPR